MEELTFLLQGVGMVTIMLIILAVVFVVGWICGIDHKDDK